MVELFIHNPLCWLMLIVALFAYQQIGMIYLNKNAPADNDDADSPEAEIQQGLPSVLVGALPLMGLLGTIMGLEGSFTGMMTHGADSQIVSSGIADALFTTQLGLVLAIPGWLFMTVVKGSLNRACAEMPHD